MYRQYKQFIDPDLFFSPFGDHGVGHTRRVLYLALKLANRYALPENDKKILAIACCYHDIGRVNDWPDDDHGQRSCKKLLKLGLDKKHNLTGNELDTVLKLITYHSLTDDMFVGDDRELLLYKMIKDADALDRLRFHHLDIKYLRLPESKEMLSLAFSLLRTDGVIE